MKIKRYTIDIFITSWSHEKDSVTHTVFVQICHGIGPSVCIHKGLPFAMLLLPSKPMLWSI